MTVRTIQKLSSVLILAVVCFGQMAKADPLPFGEAADGTRIVFDSRLPNDYKKATKWIDGFYSDRPATPQAYVKRMKANCSKRYGGHGALGMLAALGPEMMEEVPQEFVGDAIGFSTAQVAAAPEDDPGWFIHWAESTFSHDTLYQIAIAVAAQTTISHMAFDLMDDVCQYYMLPSRNKIPIPLDGIETGAGARQLTEMTVEEATIVKRVYNHVRVRRALVNGGAMGVGMVLGQNFIEAKNDPSLRLCVRKMGKKRWGQVEEFAEVSDACRTAARTWFSKAKAADLAGSIVFNLLTGGITYGVREAGGAALKASGMMDRSQLLRYLSSHEVRARLARSVRYRQGAKAAWYTIRGVKLAAATTGVGFAVEVLLEAGTGIVVYYADKNLYQPIISPWIKAKTFEWELKSDTRDLEQSMNIALSGRQNWMGKKYISGGGFGPGQTIDVPIEPVETIVSNLQFKTSEWRNHTLQDVNEIRDHWTDTVKYPDAVLNQAKSFYEAMIDLGGHDSLYPTPLTWDFFTNPNTRYKTPLKNAISKLLADSKESKQKIDDLGYEVDTAQYYIKMILTPEGQRQLLADKLVSADFLKRAQAPAVRASLLADLAKLDEITPALKAAYFRQDAEKNLTFAISSLVKMVNDPKSIFGFPALYRAGNGSTSEKWARSLKQNLDMGDKYGYFDKSDNCGQVRAKNGKGTRLVKRVDRYPAPLNIHGELEARYRCNNEERYAFVNGVYTNRIYLALKNYVGFPFKLQPKVEDVEQILNGISRDLFEQNVLTGLTPQKPYGISSPLLSKGSTFLGFSAPFAAESMTNVRLYSNLDLFVNRMLCGNWLDSSFVGDNDVPLISALKAEGLHVKMGAPRIAVELDGKSVPFVCQLGTGMAYKKYVDYYSKDFMFVDRKNVAPLRNALSYTGQMTGNLAPGDNNTIPRQYTDFLDLAMRRVHPMFLKDPSKFEKLWTERVEKPYMALADNRGLQGRYENLMRTTMRNQGTIWRRRGVYEKCDGWLQTANCVATNVYQGGNLMEPRPAAWSAFQHYGIGTPEQRRINKSITSGLDAYVKANLDQPLTTMEDQAGRGLFAASSAEVTLHSKLIWKVVKNLQGRLGKQGVNTLPDVAEVAVRLRRLARANEITWQMIDEHTPLHPKACTPEQIKKGCSSSRVAAFGIVEAVLPMLGYKDQQNFMKQLEIKQNERLLPKLAATDNRLATNLSNRNDESIDQMMARFASEIKSTPQDPMGTIRNTLPDIAWKFSRTDSFFRTAKTFAMMSVELDLLRATKAATNLIWMKKKTPKGEVYLLSSQDQVVLNSIIFESVKAIHSSFLAIHNQVALFDSFKKGGGDEKVNAKFSKIEELAHKMQDITSSSFDHLTETPCQHRLYLDSIYKSRPDLNRSVSCAVQAGKLTLDASALKRFERMVP